MAPSPEEALELTAGVAVVGHDDLTASRGEQRRVDFERVAGDLALVDVELGRVSVWQPGGVQARCSCSPQEKREWLAQ